MKSKSNLSRVIILLIILVILTIPNLISKTSTMTDCDSCLENGFQETNSVYNQCVGQGGNPDLCHIQAINAGCSYVVSHCSPCMGAVALCSID